MRYLSWGKIVAVTAIASSGAGCGGSGGGSAGSSATESATASTTGAGGSGGNTASNSATAVSTNATSGGGGSGGLLPAWESCEPPATKCKGRCVTAAAPVEDCEVMLEGSFDALQLVGDTLYVRDYSEIHQMPKGGGALTPVQTTDTAAYFHVSGDYLYWAWEFALGGSEDPMPVGGYVARLPLSGGTPEYVVDELEQVRSMRVVGDLLLMGDCPTVGPGAVYSTGPLGQVTLDDPATLLVQSNSDVCSIESDGEYVYAGIETSDGIGQIVRVSVGGGDAEVLYEGAEQDGFVLHLDGRTLYWVSFANRLTAFPPAGQVGKIDLDSVTNTLLGENDGFSTDLTSDGNYLYLASSTIIWRLPATGGATERVITTESSQIVDYVLDGSTLIIALSGEDDHVAGLLRTSTEPERVPTE